MDYLLVLRMVDQMAGTLVEPMAEKMVSESCQRIFVCAMLMDYLLVLRMID
jgi:hypothetical protein